MSTGADQTRLTPATFTDAGETVARALERAAVPSPAPRASAGPSPVDDAVAALSAAMAARIAAASAELAPRGPSIRDAAAAAAQSLTAQDQTNAETIHSVAAVDGAGDEQT
jgi:hypothetical protein